MDDISINPAYHEQLKVEALNSKMHWQFQHFSYFLMVLYEKEDLFALSAMTLSNIPWVFAAEHFGARIWRQFIPANRNR